MSGALVTLLAILAQASLPPPVPTAVAAGSSPAPTSFYDDGFVISDPNGRYRLRTTGLVVAQYLGAKRQGQSGLVDSGASLRRARLAWDGSVVSPKLTFKIEISADQGAFAPLDLYMEFLPTSRWSIRAGQMRVPFSRIWLTPERALLFAERASATEAFRYDYDVGVLLESRWVSRRLRAMLGVFNGAGKNVPGNDNVDPMLAARVEGVPLGAPTSFDAGVIGSVPAPALAVGVSATLDYVPVPVAYGFASGVPLGARQIVVRDVDMNGRPDGVTTGQIEADVTARWRGLAFEGEAYARKESWREIGLSQPGANRFVPRDQFGGMVLQLSAFSALLAAAAGLRLSVATVSPLRVGGVAGSTETCVGPDGVAFACSLPLADRRYELGATITRLFFEGAARVSATYSLLTWRASTGEAVPNARDQVLTLIAQVGF